jgi:hypothetical protein
VWLGAIIAVLSLLLAAPVGGCSSDESRDEEYGVLSSDFYIFLERYWTWKTAGTDYEKLRRSMPVSLGNRRDLEGFERLYFDAAVSGLWWDVVDTLTSRGIPGDWMSRTSVAQILLSFTLHSAPPASFARVAFAIPADAPVAIIEEVEPGIKKLHYDRRVHFPPPDPAKAEVEWPEELLGPRFLRASYGTRVRAMLVLTTFMGLGSRWRDGPSTDHPDIHEVEAERMRLILEAIAAEPEACAEPIGAKHLLCAFASHETDTAVWTLELQDHARWLIDQLLISGDPCINTRLPECLWDWDLHETLFGVSFY